MATMPGEKLQMGRAGAERQWGQRSGSCGLGGSCALTLTRQRQRRQPSAPALGAHACTPTPLPFVSATSEANNCVRARLVAP